MDETVTLQLQMGQEVGSVILINKFNVKPEEVDQLRTAWAADGAYFKRQPGFISAIRLQSKNITSLLSSIVAAETNRRLKNVPCVANFVILAPLDR